jgi:hypothetical protein
METITAVEFGYELVVTSAIEELHVAGHPICMLDSLVVERTVVDAHAQLSILLLLEQDR